jgi:hypothetical protein
VQRGVTSRENFHMATYSKELATRICEDVARMGSLNRVLKQKGMPTRNAFISWVMRDKDLAAEYAQARAVGIDVLAEETLDLADDADPEEIAKAKIQIETRRWIAERSMPKVWGVRQGVDLTNSDGSMAPDDTTRAARLAALMDTAKARKEASADAPE